MPSKKKRKPATAAAKPNPKTSGEIGKKTRNARKKPAVALAPVRQNPRRGAKDAVLRQYAAKALAEQQERERKAARKAEREKEAEELAKLEAYMREQFAKLDAAATAGGPAVTTCPVQHWAQTLAVGTSDERKDALYKVYQNKKRAEYQRKNVSKEPQPKADWWKRAGNVYVGTLAEQHADWYMAQQGLTPLLGGNKEVSDAPGGRGLDGVWEKDGVLYVTESKYNTSQLSKDNDNGPQMSDIWIKNNANMLAANPDAQKKAVGKKVLAALGPPKTLQKLLVHIAPSGNVNIKKIEVSNKGAVQELS